jgi:hypothetical protein
VRVLRGEDLAPIGRIELGDDADNVRVDAGRDRVLVGYGKGALAIIDPATRTKAADIRLKGRPEGFQIDETGTKVFVNVPDARDVEVVELATGANRSLPTDGVRSNFPMEAFGAMVSASRARTTRARTVGREIGAAPGKRLGVVPE